MGLGAKPKISDVAGLITPARRAKYIMQSSDISQNLVHPSPPVRIAHLGEKSCVQWSERNRFSL